MMSDFSCSLSGAKLLPAFAVEQFDLLRQLAPAPRRPVDVGAQPDRLAADQVGDDVEREIVPADVALRARLEQQPLLPQLAGEIGDARRAQRRERAVRLAVGEIDHRQARGDMRARRAVEPMLDLVLQQLARLVEQIDRGKTIGKTADHLVAAPADRRQLAKLVEQRQRLHRRHIVASADR